MRIMKMNKKAFDTGNLPSLLKQARLIKDSNAFPSLMYVSKKDEKKLRDNFKAWGKKKYPHLTEKRLIAGVGMEFLNLGPNIYEGEELPSGFMLIDDIAMRDEV